MSQGGNPADRRQFGRRKTNLSGWLIVPGRPRLPCTVLDLSVGGALIGLRGKTWLPYTFQLYIEASRFSTWCEVRHQRENAVGVRFLSAVEAAALDQRGAQEGRSMNECDAWSGTLDKSANR